MAQVLIRIRIKCRSDWDCGRRALHSLATGRSYCSFFPMPGFRLSRDTRETRLAVCCRRYEAPGHRPLRPVDSCLPNSFPVDWMAGGGVRPGLAVVRREVQVAGHDVDRQQIALARMKRDLTAPRSKSSFRLRSVGGRSSMVEPQIVVLDVAGSSPVGHPTSFFRLSQPHAPLATRCRCDDLPL